jgi:hypothetical protein
VKSVENCRDEDKEKKYFPKRRMRMKNILDGEK